MPSQSSFSINDGNATPVAHVFTPNGVTAKAREVIAVWFNRAASTLAAGAETLSSFVRPKEPDGSYKARFEILVPVTQTVSGIAVVTHTNRAMVTVSLAGASSAQDAKNMRALLANAFASGTQFALAIENREAVYG